MLTFVDALPVTIVIAVQSHPLQRRLSLSGPFVHRCAGEGQLRQEREFHLMHMELCNFDRSKGGYLLDRFWGDGDRCSSSGLHRCKNDAAFLAR